MIGGREVQMASVYQYQYNIIICWTHNMSRLLQFALLFTYIWHIGHIKLSWMAGQHHLIRDAHLSLATPRLEVGFA
jgi:hypothetical protein